MPDLTFKKTPAEIVDFKASWNRWLSYGDAIKSVTHTVQEGSVSIVEESARGQITTVRVAGGAKDQVSTIVAQVETRKGQILEATLAIDVE